MKDLPADAAVAVLRLLIGKVPAGLRAGESATAIVLDDPALGGAQSSDGNPRDTGWRL